MIKWNVLKTDKNIIETYQNDLKINKLLAITLANRGIDFNSIDEIINCKDSGLVSPYKLINVERGSKQLLKAIEEGYIIYVYADYDCDGLDSGYLMTSYLTDICDNEVYVRFPDRTDGYGLNIEFCSKIIEDNKNKKVLVITVDNGTSCREEIKLLQENGIDVLITDHHKANGELPNCTIVNPHIDEDDSLHHLAGVGVVYKMLEVFQDIANVKNDILYKYKFAVAIGTIADVMPMTKDNIIMIRQGLKQLNSKNAHIGLKKLKGLVIGKDDFNPSNIAWTIAPILNACGRMGEIRVAANIFFGQDEDAISDAVFKAVEINENRKKITKEAVAEMNSIDYSFDTVCMFDMSKYPPGIAGILAGKLAEATGKPSLVYAGKDTITGSARSIQCIDIERALSEQKKVGNLENFGGHSQAAGFELTRDKLNDLKLDIESKLEEFVIEVEEKEDSTINIDAEIDLADLNINSFNAIQSLPYDKVYFTSPLFKIDVEVLGVTESKNNSENIQLELRDEFGHIKKVWAWNYGTKYKNLGEPNSISIIGNIDKGFKNDITMRILDMRALI